ncbi:phBC6A51 family helix-turn-helix protein [Dysgonomonas sp. 511]|uniref:phBC6A51 family helix-turn-helix protein n=1 Tax=Dysgonomonas sp. 511 TaxID=2302930 RepID=UPI0013D50DDF|nr:phBC6A51 family helix-turn-helix protein [Dysgonomonas sp. 511]NDV78381.1 hypothetical protein [Dysgonomonas sp. 511]
MAKFTTELATRILQMIEHDMYTVAEICRAVGINRKTFYEWKNTKPEFCDAIEEAIERRNEALVMLARMSLKKKLEGYTITEEKYYYEPAKGNPQEMVLKKKVVKKKEVAPDHRAIKMVLERDGRKQVEESPVENKLIEIGVVDDETKVMLEDFLGEKAVSTYRVVSRGKSPLDSQAPPTAPKGGLEQSHY